jgi:DNA-binding transcriptional regulator GbsR (MarR family)
MASPSRHAEQLLSQAQDRLIAAWGQMGSTWGISRTMAEIHALLYIVGRPMFADEVMERLKISRGNASMSLRALVDWGVVTRVHKRGDRKEYFQAEADVWAMVRSIIRERLRREVTPVLASLYDIRDLTDDQPGGDAVTEHNRRVDELVALVQLIDRVGEKFVAVDAGALKAAAEALSGDAGAAGGGER